MSVVVLVPGVEGLDKLGAAASPLPYWRGWDSALEKAGFTVARAELGAGLTLKHAIEVLRVQLPTLAPGDEPVHLVGHGRGGLVARGFTLEERERVRSVTCVGTPHRGLYAANLLLQMPTGTLTGDETRRTKALAGADPVEIGAGVLAELDPRALEQLNETMPNRRGVAYADVIGRLEQCLPTDLVAPVARLTELAGEQFAVPVGPLRRARRWWQDHQVRTYGEVCDLGLPGKNGPRNHDGVVATDAARNPWQRHPTLPRWKCDSNPALLSWPLDHAQLAGIEDDRALRPAIRGWIRQFLKPADEDSTWAP